MLVIRGIVEPWLAAILVAVGPLGLRGQFTPFVVASGLRLNCEPTRSASVAFESDLHRAWFTTVARRTIFCLSRNSLSVLRSAVLHEMSDRRYLTHVPVAL